MSHVTAQKIAWTKPEVQQIGTIGDVAGRNSTTSNQVINDCGSTGGGTCKS